MKLWGKNIDCLNIITYYYIHIIISHINHHPLLHMQLETQLWGSGVLVSSYCWSSYRIADPFSTLDTFSSSFIRGPVFQPINDCEHPLLYLPDTGIASQEKTISGTCQQNLAGIAVVSGFGDWLCMDPQVWQSLDGPSFHLSSKLCLCNSFHGYLVSHSKEGRSMHNLIFLFEFHVFYKFYIGYIKILG
jgi:hypothetical protein